MNRSTVETIPPTGTIAGPAPSAAEVAAAEAYENIFVPALFARWSPLLADAAGIVAGDRVLDIACGTGTATAAAARAAGESGTVVGLDIAPGMLFAAGLQRSLVRATTVPLVTEAFDWRHGDAMALPFAAAGFDRVLCQFGLMFVADPRVALGEMLRVLRPGGRFAIAVWNALEDNPGFAAKVAILESLAGKRAADALRAPFVLGDGERLLEMASAAGAAEATLRSVPGEAVFASIDDFVDAELRGWLPVMGVELDEPTIARIRERCYQRMGHYRDGGNGRFTMPTSAHLLTGLR